MFSATPRTVILVHGIWMTGLEMQWLARGLRRTGGWRMRTFHYPSVRAGLVENARRLAAFCDAVAREDGGRPVHLVGHSLGGIVVWRMALDFPGQAEAENAGRVVTLGAPFGGSALARHILDRGGAWLGPRLVGGTYVPEAAGDWPAERAWPAVTGGRELGVLAGDWPFGVGHLLGAFQGPNDGVVAVDETPIAGAADYRVLPVNHVALTFALEAIRQTAHFLTHGRFDQLQMERGCRKMEERIQG